MKLSVLSKNFDQGKQVNKFPDSVLVSLNLDNLRGEVKG